MYKVFFPLLILLSIVCSAQKNEPIIVKAGNNIKESISLNDQYVYPQFKDGAVYFLEGSVSNVKLNYNKLFREMQYIDAKGDTLAIANGNMVKMVVIDTDTYYFSDDYLKLVSGNNDFKLAVRQSLIIADRQKLGGYDSRSSSSAITSISSIPDGARQIPLKVNEDLLFSREERFYIGDKYNHFLPINKKNLLELFGKYEDELKQYLKEQKPSFNKKDDMVKLVEFLEKQEKS
jgi:hypothetical protein